MSEQYYQRKKSLLQSCLRYSEEAASSMEAWENLSSILDEREAVVDQLSELEEQIDPSVKDAMPDDRKQELDQMIKLILEFDQNTVRLMRAEQDNIMSSLKTNVKSQKTIQYGPTTQVPSGTRMDFKK